MTNTLVLLRHAKAEPFGSGGDHSRALDGRGRKQAAAIGPQIAAAVGTPTLVLCSSATRTQQTWTIAANAAGWDVDSARIVDELYGAGPHDVLDLLAEYGAMFADGEDATVLVIGHEPTMSGTARLLAGSGSSDAVLAQIQVGVPTSSASISRSELSFDRWEPGATVLLDLLRVNE